MTPQNDQIRARAQCRISSLIQLTQLGFDNLVLFIGKPATVDDMGSESPKTMVWRKETSIPFMN